MENVSIVEEYSKSLENYIVLLGNITYEEVASNLDNLENNILDYLHNKFSNMSVSKDELHTILINMYQTKNFSLKKSVECNLGHTKFEFEDKRHNAEKIIIEELKKMRKLFFSVQIGTNYNYFGFVDECTLKIIGHLIRNHNSIAFSKNTENTKKDIRALIENNYKIIMNNMGEQLISRVLEPLENKFIPVPDKAISKSNL